MVIDMGGRAYSTPKRVAKAALVADLEASRSLMSIAETRVGRDESKRRVDTRFRTTGRYIVTLRAIDTPNALSRIVSRSLVQR